MSFANPINWLWLLPLIGAIILLWLHRPRREEVVVPSLRLWRGLITEDNADPTRRFLHRRLLLFLQLLTVFLLTLALARPFLFAQAPVGQRYVLIVDNSASMQANDVRPSRLEAARAEAALFIGRHLRPEDSALVLQTSPRAQALCQMASDPALLRAAVQQVVSTDAPGDMAGALLLARSLVGRNAKAHVQVYSDGLSAAAGGTAAPAPGMDTHQVVIGTRRPDNNGITALTLQSTTAGSHALFVTVSHAGMENHLPLTLSLLVDGRLMDARQVVFLKSIFHAQFRIPASTQSQTAAVRLDHAADDLASDNSASLIVAPTRKARVLLVSSGSFFLERGLASLPTVQVSEMTPAQFALLRPQAASPNVVVLDGSSPAGPLPPGRYLTFGRAGLPTPLTFTPQAPADTVVLMQNSAHPVMRFVDMRPLRVRSTVRAQSAAWGQILVDGRRGPLIIAGEANDSRVVSVGFNLADSDLPLRAAFPLFLSNSIAWLTEGSTPGTLLPDYAAGQVAQVVLPSGVGTAQVTRPDGTTRFVFPAPSGGAAALADTSQVGIYTVRGLDGARYPVAVNLLNPTASALLPRQSPLLERPLASGSAGAMHRVPREWWPVVATMALLLLAAEWWVYHRRA